MVLLVVFLFWFFQSYIVCWHFTNIPSSIHGKKQEKRKLSLLWFVITMIIHLIASVFMMQLCGK